MKITIPKPCHENWEMMAPEEKGRFCSVCSKTVYDFTALSDQELINAFSDQEENVCGRFNEFQLNRDLQYSFINALFIKFAVGFVLTAGGFVSVNAQEHIKNDTLKTEEPDKIIVLASHTRQKMRIGGATATVKNEDEPVYIINGKLSSLKELRTLDPKLIKMVNVIKDTTLFNGKVQNGVVVITTKKKWKSKK
ncbi:hypothetical protein [Chryseobacterium flavum]|uniref:hypothetical protein n=1 Tax=Chryseobacterium flavum TaxID=415851 RepID=UPI002FDA1AD6